MSSLLQFRGQVAAGKVRLEFKHMSPSEKYPDSAVLGVEAETFECQCGRTHPAIFVAWRVLGWQTVPDEDTEWTGIEARTGMLVCVMVGDDAHHLYDPKDVEPLAREEYCGVCGQIGCAHDGR